MDTRLYSLASVAAILDVEDADVLACLAACQFPVPVVLPNGERRWTSHDVERWIGERPTERAEGGQRAA